MALIRVKNRSHPMEKTVSFIRLLSVKKSVNFNFRVIEEKRIGELDQLTQEKFSFYYKKVQIDDLTSKTSLRKKCPNTEFFLVPYFPVFGLNTEIYGVNRRIQFEYRKMRARKNSVFGHFSRSAFLRC